jgi:hypothetical protein
MLHNISTQILQQQVVAGQLHKQFATQDLTSNIQVNGLPNVILKDVIFVLIKAKSEELFTNMKSVNYFSVVIGVSHYIIQNCITANCVLCVKQSFIWGLLMCNTLSGNTGNCDNPMTQSATKTCVGTGLPLVYDAK